MEVSWTLKMFPLVTALSSPAGCRRKSIWASVAIGAAGPPDVATTLRREGGGDAVPAPAARSQRHGGHGGPGRGRRCRPPRGDRARGHPRSGERRGPRGGPARRGRRRCRVLAHQRQPDPRRGRQPGADRGDQLVRVRDPRRGRPRPVGAGLPRDHQRHQEPRLQHHPDPVLEPDGREPDRAAEPELQQQLGPDQLRPQGPELAADPRQDHHLRRAGWPHGHPGRPPVRGGGVGRGQRPLVHQHLHQPGLG